MDAENSVSATMSKHEAVEMGAGPEHRGVVDRKKTPGSIKARYSKDQKVKMRTSESTPFRYDVTVVAAKWDSDQGAWVYDVEDSAGNPTDDVPQGNLKKQ